MLQRKASTLSHDAVCNVHNVALATNLATADLIIMAFARREELQAPVIGSKPLTRHPRFT